MTDMKIKTGIRKNPVRGPLKAMPQTAMKPTRGDPPMTAAKSVFKRLQPSNTSSSSNTSMIEVGFGNKMFFKKTCILYVSFNTLSNHDLIAFY